MNIGWTTTSNCEDAEKLAQECVKQRLVACAQVEGPIRSFYSWQGKLENEEEFKVTFKFLAKNTEKLEAWIKENHPYDVPQWITVRADRVLAAYLNWAKESAQEEKDRGVDLQKAVELSKRGNDLLRKKRYPEAEKTFLEVLELDDENPYVLVGLGDLYRETNRFEDAISSYEKVLESDSVNVFALRGIGDAYRGIRQLDPAINYWKRYLEHNKNDVHVMTRLADSFFKMGNFSESESYYLSALEINDSDKYALLGVGNLYYKTGDNEQALQYFEKLISLDDGYVAVLTMMGNIYRRRKDFDKAVTYYEKAIRQDAGNTFALYGLGDSYRGLKNYAESVDWWTKILEKEPKNQELLSRVGDALLNLDRKDEALDYYQRSKQIGFDPFALLGMSKIYRKSNNYEEAELCCREALDKTPDDRRFLKELAKIFDAKGDSAKAGDVRARLGDDIG